MAKAQRRHLAHEAHFSWLRQISTHGFEDLGFAFRGQFGLQFIASIEVVLDAALASADNEYEVLDSGRAPFGHDMRKYRPIKDIQQIFRRRLGCREDSGAQPRHRQNRLAYARHCVPLRAMIRSYSTVTDFARLRGWSTSAPLNTPTW